MSEQLPEDFKHYIRIIGRGQRAGRTLTQAEAHKAMTMLINGQVTAEQKGAFLMLLRVREETPEELAGFTQALREFNQPSVQQLNIDLDLGCYAGKRRHLPWFVLAVMTLAQSGKRIFLHGTHEPDSKRLYLSEVFADLGFRTATNSKQAAEDLDGKGFCYMDLVSFNSPLDELIQLRALFGLRSCANTLARMLNPTNAPFSLQGVFHRHVDEKHRQTAALLNSNDVLCFRGEGGEIEYNPERDVVLHHFQQGNQSCYDVTASLESRVIKPRKLDSRDLIGFWQGDSQDQYGQQAVIGTLSVMLLLMEKLDWSEAQEKALSLWNNRCKSWPASDKNASVSPHIFDTQGRHYAH